MGNPSAQTPTVTKIPIDEFCERVARVFETMNRREANRLMLVYEAMIGAGDSDYVELEDFYLTTLQEVLK